MVALPEIFHSTAYQHISMAAPRDYRELGNRIRMLLASIIRRAAFDIALYRGSSRLEERLVAVGAYNWMFRNDPIHPYDRFTSFLHICDVLDEDPEWIRSATLKLQRGDVKKYQRIERDAR
jgi:hypothetical protein